MTVLIILGVIAALAIILGSMFVRIQNSLIGKEERVKSSLSNIGVQMQSRWDALKQLANTVTGYKTHEAETLKAVIEARTGYTPRNEKQINESEKDYNVARGAINVLMEQYPELKANESFGKMIDSINEYEEKVRIGRQVYNDTVTIFNQEVRSFPSSIVARMINMNTYDYLETPEEKKDMPELKF